MDRQISASEARHNLAKLLDDAQRGDITVVIRNSTPCAAIIPARDLEAFRVFQRVMREIDETLEVSRDPDIIAAVKDAQGQIDAEKIIWHAERFRAAGKVKSPAKAAAARKNGAKGGRPRKS